MSNLKKTGSKGRMKAKKDRSCWRTERSGVKYSVVNTIESFTVILSHFSGEVNPQIKKKGNGMEKTKYRLSDEEVEREIERLNASEAVALARREERLRYRRRQYLYKLRDLEKRGFALLAAGFAGEIPEGHNEDGR